MIRLLLLLLLLVVPLQMTYAVAAGYCSHDEQGASASHFGHHAHKHAKLYADTKLPQGEADIDCDLCQLGCTHVTLPVIPRVASIDSIDVVPPPIDGYRSIVPLAYTPPPLAAYRA